MHPVADPHVSIFQTVVEDSGLLKGIDMLKEIKGISTIFFSNEDIVRHPLVGKIVKAFDHRKKADPK